MVGQTPFLRQSLRGMAVPVAMTGFGLLAGLMIFAASASRFTPTMPRSGLVDAVVVLTGGEHRVREGLRLFEETRARRILISGVHHQTTREELKRRAGRGVAPTLFSCCVDVGYRALDTTGNADEAAFWAATWGFKRIAVVTSTYHMPRGLLELSRALPNADLVPHAVTSPTFGAGRWWTSPTTIRIIAIEYAKALPALARLGLSRLIG